MKMIQEESIILKEESSRRKDYFIGNLEKKLDQLPYYEVRNKEGKEEFVNDVSDILNRLKGFKVEDEERKVMRKAIDVIQKMRIFLR